MNRKIFAIIPARAGSKRLPGKNYKEMLGKPLIQWTIDAAKKSKLLTNFEVNSNDPKILEIAKANNVIGYHRDNSLAEDDSSIYDVILGQIKEYPKNGVDDIFGAIKSITPFNDDDLIVLLEPTSPLRKDDDIDNAIKQFIRSGKDSLVSIGKVNLEAPNCYFPYGVIYISKIGSLFKHKTFYQPNTSFYLIEDWQCYEIDTPVDFIKVEAIMKWRKY